MPDIEKVIKGLTRLSTLGVPDCDKGSCPFWRVCVDGEGCYFDMFSSALALLKEQEETELCDRCGRVRLKSKWERR